MSATPEGTPTPRVAAIDRLRGLAMALMAIDHVRVFSGLPPGGPTAGIFFTRWVTHFCAPAFVFLAGTSAYLYGRRHADLSRHLLIRGAWLVFLELTFLRLAWTFNLDFGFEMAGVIWAIGWSMILMAGLVRLPLAAVATIGLALVAGHDLAYQILQRSLPAFAGGSFGGLWKILYLGFFFGPLQLGEDGPRLIVLYSIVPWIGVMAAGYAFGRIVTLEPGRRNRICVALGLGALALFLVLRGLNLYGDPRPWGGPTLPGAPPTPALFSFLNASKYPASFAFLLMTLGPLLAVIPLMERLSGAAARTLTVLGRVPFFFYLLHIPLIHALALGVSQLRLGQVSPWLFENHPMGNSPAPDGYSWSLGTLYAVWAVAMAILTPACLGFAGLKARRKDWWLAYL